MTQTTHDVDERTLSFGGISELIEPTGLHFWNVGDEGQQKMGRLPSQKRWRWRK